MFKNELLLIHSSSCTERTAAAEPTEVRLWMADWIQLEENCANATAIICPSWILVASLM